MRISVFVIGTLFLFLSICPGCKKDGINFVTGSYLVSGGSDQGYGGSYTLDTITNDTLWVTKINQTTIQVNSAACGLNQQLSFDANPNQNSTYVQNYSEYYTYDNGASTEFGHVQVSFQKDGSGEVQAGYNSGSETHPASCGVTGSKIH